MYAEYQIEYHTKKFGSIRGIPYGIILDNAVLQSVRLSLNVYRISSADRILTDERAIILHR